MSWSVLQTALWDLPPTGPEGFEGLACRLLELVGGERFFLARSGDQPGGDARAFSGEMAMQAKRYSTTELTDAKLETDFHAARRALNDLEVYVIAITKFTGQNISRIEVLSEETGIDIIAMDWEGEIPTLGALCVRHWEEVGSFLNLDNGFADWASEQCETPSVRQRVEEFKNQLKLQLFGIDHLRNLANKYLDQRFGLVQPQLPYYRIDLNEAVPRNVGSLLTEWWNTGTALPAVVVGDDGMGKSWLTADVTKRLAQDSAVLVLWLESADWANCLDLDQLLKKGFSKIGVRAHDAVQRYSRKAVKYWSKQTLLVLDGVNENDALSTAQSLLEQVFTQNVPSVRLLFTSRPLEKRERYSPLLWNSVKQVKVGPFDDAEFTLALSRCKHPLSLHEIPSALREWARVPRFLQTCVRLRQQFSGLESVTRELLLWVDLLDRIRAGDLQVRELLGWTDQDDAADVLMQLAKAASSISEEGTTSAKILNECFAGKYNEVRNELTELRITENATPLRASLSRAHVVLGYALYLNKLINISNDSVKETADRIIHSLEPLASADERTEAVFVALQLSTFESFERTASETRIRAAFLLVWVNLHNRYGVKPRLGFWAGRDPLAYAEFMDIFFESIEHGWRQSEVVEPLAIAWRTGNRSILQPIIRRWLLLCWQPQPDPANREIDHEGHKLPLANSEQHIRLSSIALSLISLAPEVGLLRDFAICRATLALSFVIQKHSRPEGQVNDFKIAIKRLEKAIGIVMRWSYTETVLPELERLAHENKADSLLLNGLRKLAADLMTISLPGVLQTPKIENTDDWKGVLPQILVRQGKLLFAPNPDGEFPSLSRFGYLAVRDDLPELQEMDKTSLRHLFDQTFDPYLSHPGPSIFNPRHEVKWLWPWWAKLFPGDMPDRIGRVRHAAMETHQPLESLYKLRAVLRNPVSLRIGEVRNRLEACAARFLQATNNHAHESVLIEIWPLAILELSEDENELKAWLTFAGKYPQLMWASQFMPSTDLLRLVGSKELDEFIFSNFQQASPNVNEGVEPVRTPSGYWCNLAGYTTSPDPAKYEWVKDQFRRLNPHGDHRYWWKRLLFACAPPDLFACDFANGEWPDILDNSGIQALASSRHRLGDIVPNQCPYENIMKWVRHDWAGSFFNCFGRTKDFQRWGEELFLHAKKKLGEPPFTPAYDGTTTCFTNENGAVVEMSFQAPSTQSGFRSVFPSSWGIDQVPFKLFDEQEYQRVWKELHDRWNRDANGLLAWDGFDLNNFSAPMALREWRKTNPERFLALARSLLDRVAENPKGAFHLGCFVDGLLCNLLSLEPEDAVGRIEKLREFPFRIRTRSDVSTFHAELWDLAECNQPFHAKLRSQMFLEAANDQEIMMLCIAAQASGGIPELWRIVEKEYLPSDIARERALAVSILMWVPDERAITVLNGLYASDPSEWVREHAAFATEVAWGERSARQYYRQILQANDTVRISVQLEVLRAALTPTAAWWRTEVEKTEKCEFTIGRKAAVINNFWHHFDCETNRPTVVLGQTLEDHLRGENIDVRKDSLLAPWWKLEPQKPAIV